MKEILDSLALMDAQISKLFELANGPQDKGRMKKIRFFVDAIRIQHTQTITGLLRQPKKKWWQRWK